jgi:hypothetical protein
MRHTERTLKVPMRTTGRQGTNSVERARARDHAGEGSVEHGKQHYENGRKKPSAAAHSGARATASSENDMLFRRFKGIYSPRKKVEAAKSS